MNPVHLHWVQEVRGTNVRRAAVYSMDDMRRAGGMGENRKAENFWSLSDAVSNRWRDIPPSLKNLFQLEGHDGLVLVD
jgi:hypothetical protein